MVTSQLKKVIASAAMVLLVGSSISTASSALPQGQEGRLSALQNVFQGKFGRQASPQELECFYNGKYELNNPDTDSILKYIDGMVKGKNPTAPAGLSCPYLAGVVTPPPPQDPQKLLTAPPIKGMLTAPEPQKLITAPPTKGMLTAPEPQKLITAPPTKGMLTAPEPQKLITAPPVQGLLTYPEREVTEATHEVVEAPEGPILFEKKLKERRERKQQVREAETGGESPLLGGTGKATGMLGEPVQQGYVGGAPMIDGPEVVEVPGLSADVPQAIEQVKDAHGAVNFIRAKMDEVNAGVAPEKDAKLEALAEAFTKAQRAWQMQNNDAGIKAAQEADEALKGGGANEW